MMSFPQENKKGSCSYKTDKNGGLVLADADHSYFCLTGLTIADLGKSPQELGDDLPEKLLKLCEMTGSPVRVPKIFADGSSGMILAQISGENLVCRIVPTDTSGNKSLGTLTAVRTENGFAAESFGGGAEELLLHPKKRAPLNEIFGNAFESAEISPVTENAVLNGSPEEFLLISCGVHGLHRAVNVTAYPVISQKTRIFFSFREKEYHDSGVPAECFSAEGKFRVSGTGGYFTEMNGYLAAMLEKGSVSAGDISKAAALACANGCGTSLVGSGGACAFAYPDEKARCSTYICAYETDPAADGFGIRSPQLTKREYTVVHLAAKGFSNADIGERLGISGGTVSKILYNSYRKINIFSRVDAAGYFCCHGGVPKYDDIYTPL